MGSPAPDAPLILAERDRPFWGFAEIFIIGALFLPAVLAGSALIGAIENVLHGNPRLGLPLLLAEFIGYGIIFIVLRLLFARYQKPLLSSLAWVPQRFRVGPLILTGLALSTIVVVLGGLLQVPNKQTPFDKLLMDPASRIAIAVFGITLAPIVEELLFRGFLQPVLIEAMGVLPGILVTSVLFGALHLQQNANIWQSGVLITFVGFVLGVIRHVSGSTRASAIVHSAYNSLPFVFLLFSGNNP